MRLEKDRGFQNPEGTVEGYGRVGVRVQMLLPSTNPYPWWGYRGYRGYRRGIELERGTSAGTELSLCERTKRHVPYRFLLSYRLLSFLLDIRQYNHCSFLSLARRTQDTRHNRINDEACKPDALQSASDSHPPVAILPRAQEVKNIHFRSRSSSRF